MSDARLDGLYGITPDLADTAELLRRVDAALRGGLRWLQYRNKAADAALRHEQALALAARCRAAGAGLIINDDLRLAHAVGAAGVHLGGDDGDLAAAREYLGAKAILGASCYADLARAHRARAAGASYVAFGAVFASSVKPNAVVAPLTLLTRARRDVGLPVAAIGGITLADVPALRAAGADLLAVITDLFATADIADRAAAYLHACAATPAACAHTTCQDLS